MFPKISAYCEKTRLCAMNAIRVFALSTRFSAAFVEIDYTRVVYSGGLQATKTLKTLSV